MILITAEEKAAICEKFPNAYIVRTMKKKSGRGRYYCAEESRVMSYLKELRKAKYAEVHL